MLRLMQFFEKKATFAQLIKNWIISYFGNLAGAMLTLKLLALTGLALASPAAVKLATTKTSFTFVEVGTPPPSAVLLFHQNIPRSTISKSCHSTYQETFFFSMHWEYLLSPIPEAYGNIYLLNE
jgi:hypothetical protein